MIDMLRRTAVRAFRIAHFLGYFVYELVISNLWVAWLIIRPRKGISSAILAMPMRSQTVLERTTFVGIVTLTPGTLSLDLRDEPGVLYLHVMQTQDVEQFRARQSYYEDLLLAALRPVGPKNNNGAEAGAQEGRS